MTRIPLTEDTEGVTSGNDSITAFDQFVHFGLAGDDTFVQTLGAQDNLSSYSLNYFIGGSGNDTYIVNPDLLENFNDDTVIIDDTGSSGNDTLILNIPSLSELSTFYIESNKHLVIEYSGLNVVVLNWQDEDSRIENIQFTDGNFTFNSLPFALNLLEGFYTSDQVKSTRFGLFFQFEDGDVVETFDYMHSRASQLETALPEIPVFTSTLGDDSFRGSENADSLLGSDGNDTLRSEGANDFVQGNQGNDYLRGGAGADTVFGGKGSDNLNGNLGDDFVNGNNDVDSVRGGKGLDTVRGGKGDDSVFGDADGDEIYGDLGNDSIRGGKGGDSIFGGDGNDTIWGDLGVDHVTGGDGADRFVFKNGHVFYDQILDFQSGVDIIQVSQDLLAQNLQVVQEGDNTVLNFLQTSAFGGHITLVGTTDFDIVSDLLVA